MGLSDCESDNERKPTAKKAAGGLSKFTQSTKEYKKLKKLFQEKKILATDKPSDVRLAHPEFQRYTTQQFRAQFNKLKGLVGTVTKEGECKTSSN